MEPWKFLPIKSSFNNPHALFYSHKMRNQLAFANIIT